MTQEETELLEIEEEKKEKLAALLLLFMSKKTNLYAILLGLPLLNKELERFLVSSRKGASELAARHTDGKARGTALARKALIVAAVQRLTGALVGHAAVSGETIPKESIVDAVITSNGNRIITTEVFEAYNNTILKDLKEGEKVQWISALEKNTCGECESYHGNIYTAETCPEIPVHNHCKCYLEKV